MSEAPHHNRLNARLHRLERRFVAVLLAVMGSVVFLDVAHRVGSREGTALGRIFDNAPWTQPVGSSLTWVIAVLMFVAVLRTRGEPGGRRTWIRAVLLTVGAAAALKLFIFLVPNGLVWSQTLGLVLMLWVGCIGASMATYENRHLSLDVGSKLWPSRMLPYVQALGNLVTAVFCAGLGILSVVSLRSHYGDYAATGGAGGIFAALPIPKWIAYTVIPIGFGLMALRFLGGFKESLSGRVAEEDTLQMLGLKNADEEDGSAS